MGSDGFAYSCVLLIAAGLLVVVVGYIWLFILAFDTSVWWGMGCVVLPFVSFYFASRNWRVAKWPIGTIAAGLATVVAGALLFPRIG